MAAEPYQPLEQRLSARSCRGSDDHHLCEVVIELRPSGRLRFQEACRLASSQVHPIDIMKKLFDSFSQHQASPHQGCFFGLDHQSR